MKAWFSQWWNGTPQQAASSQVPSDVSIQDTLESLNLRRIQTQRNVESCEREARQLAANGQRQQAMQLMRKKHMYENMVKQLDAQITNAERTAHTLDDANMAADMHAAMKQASQQIRQQLNAVSVTEIETTTDELDDNMHETQDIMQALSRPIGSSVADEDALEEDIAAEMADWDTNNLNVDDILNKLPQPTPTKTKNPAAPNNGIRL